ncbi:hypothetical protein ACF3MZ_21245 [Paenibacillaceae bacterium WGS1546]|uniref:hypothetical protein n=1 Tax=Cohnella sp. WGS1546 TaxID=3366810 RepID=UPI00372D4987
MDQNVITIIAVAGTLSGIALGWIGKARTVRQDTAAEADRDATLRTDVDYIKRGVDDMRVEIRLQGQRYDVLAERVTRVEESSKQAHHRINRLEGHKD